MSVIWVTPPNSINAVRHDYVKLIQSSRNSPEKRVEIYELHNHFHTYTHQPSVTSPLLFFSLPLSFPNSLEVLSYLMRLVPPTACAAVFLQLRTTQRDRPHDEKLRERERKFHSHESVISVWWENLTPDQISCPICCFRPIDGAISELRSRLCADFLWTLKEIWCENNFISGTS